MIVEMQFLRFEEYKSFRYIAVDEKRFIIILIVVVTLGARRFGGMERVLLKGTEVFFVVLEIV